MWSVRGQLISVARCLKLGVCLRGLSQTFMNEDSVKISEFNYNTVEATECCVVMLMEKNSWEKGKCCPLKLMQHTFNLLFNVNVSAFMQGKLVLLANQNSTYPTVWKGEITCRFHLYQGRNCLSAPPGFQGMCGEVDLDVVGGLCSWLLNAISGRVADENGGWEPFVKVGDLVYVVQ